MVIESVYSMDGNIGDLPKARELCNTYNMLLVVDEAHGLGTIGKTGRGLEEHYNMPGAVDVVCGTFSKSLASVGGFISGKDDLIQYMEFFAQGNMFSAPCSAYHAGAAMKCLEKITEKP
jgi:7-keto-8-aminopelargonate synthetase-like enzyme